MNKRHGILTALCAAVFSACSYHVIGKDIVLQAPAGAPSQASIGAAPDAIELGFRDKC